MVSISTVRASNAKAKELVGIVAVFIGGTGGIGECTVKEFFRRTTQPKAYIVGRNEQRGNEIVEELKEINAEGEAIFMRKDVSLFKNVDEVCNDLQQRERKINVLFLTAGYMTLKGRLETDDGVDFKMCVNYYARMRFIFNLMPQLSIASQDGELSRVISVLAAGSEGEIRLDDLDLKHNFTLHACLAHCVVMTDFMIEELAKKYPGTSFSHSYPGTVKTGIANVLSGPARLALKVLYSIMAPWILNVQDSGERHLFQITSKCYPAKKGGVGIEVPSELQPVQGTDGTQASGAYLLDWDGNSIGDRRILDNFRAQNLGNTVWEHTTHIFKQAAQRRESKRPADGDAEGSARPAPYNPVGWRPG